MGKKTSIPDYLKKSKFKFGPEINITKGSLTPVPNVKVDTEDRFYGVKGEYNIIDTDDTKLKITGSVGKGSGRADISHPGGKNVFKGQGDLQKQFNIIFSKKFKSGGLTKWFNEKWVDIGAPKKGGRYQECGRKSASSSKGRKYPKCVPLAKATQMTKSEKASAVARKRQAPNTGPKPTNVKTFTKRYYGGMIDI